MAKEKEMTLGELIESELETQIKKAFKEYDTHPPCQGDEHKKGSGIF